MAYENLCLYCFKESNGDPICPHCGKDARAAVPQIQMLPGTTVYHDRFLVGRALGQDSGGIVYTALDTKRGGTIRIREYLPRNCAERLNDGTVVPIAGMEDAFESGMRKLRASVDSVEDPRKRHFYFEENGTAYIAQRKNNGGAAPAPEYMDDGDDAADHRKQIAIYIAIAAAVVLVVAIGLIWFLNSMSEPSDVTLPNPLSTTSPGATWMPDATPTPTPYATATFAALVDPELSWMDYTYSGDVNNDYQQQVNASATRKPVVETEQDYDTVNTGSSSNTVKALQQKLANLGWLDASKVSGKYDSATKQAVKDFQAYVNKYCNPATKLTVDGIAGEKTQQWLYNSSVSLVKPTPTPTPLVTPKPGDSAVVDASSSAAKIRDVQNKLITLGLLPQGSADGKFGSTTATAVKNFQIRVNQILKYEALNVTGVVDADTMAYLNYYVEWWEQEQKATATPKPAETATPRPEQTQSPDGSVNQGSTKAEITAMQQLLNKVGLLNASGVDGVYGPGTVAAVKTFQNWVNETRGEQTLQVTGVCDSLTRAYLDYCVENNRVVELPTDAPTSQPTQAPTSQPTQAPTSQPTQVPTSEPTQVPEYEPGEGEGEGDTGSTVVDPSSPVESISYVQEMLSEIGLLDASAVDGSYGEMTKDAVRRLQQFVNDQQGKQVLEVTGICDAQTLEYLMYCYDRGWNLTDQGDAQPEATEQPEATQTPDGGVYPSSSRSEISGMQEMLSAIGLLAEDSVDGSYGEGTAKAVRALQQFVNDQRGEHTLDVTGECDPQTLEYLKYCYSEGWNLTDSGDAPDADNPTEAPAEEPTRAPVGMVGSFTLAVSGTEAADGSLVELTPGEFTVKWYAEGEVDSYYIYLYDENNNLINKAEGSDQTKLSLKTNGMNPGEVYELRVGAKPVNGSDEDIIWKRVQLMLPVELTPEPTVTPEPTPEPTSSPSVSAPAINIGSSVYQEGGVTYINDSTVIFSWMASGDVASYTVNLMYEDGTNFSLGTTTDTSKTVSADQLQPGLYKLYVGATPVGGDDDDTIWSELLFGVPAPEATQAPEMDPTEPPAAGDENERIRYIDSSSDPEDIQTMQMALYKHGLLNADSIEPGVLDEGTLQAVAAFQQKVNEVLGAGLHVIDPAAESSVDDQTLDYLLYQSLDF